MKFVGTNGQMDINQRIKAANSRLKKSYSGVKIERNSSRLYVRGIFPPKPSSEIRASSTENFYSIREY